MKRSVVFVMVLLCAGLVFGCNKNPVTQAPAGGDKEAAMKKPAVLEVQSPVVAGAFYPGDAAALSAEINSYLAAADPPALPGRAVGFMVPHAGYRYSGPVAAYAYKLIKSSGAKRFVIMAPAHRVGFRGVYVMDKDAYRTPLGDVPIDRESAKKLIASAPYMLSNPALYGEEHAAEVQIPFLQAVGGDGLVINVLVIGQYDPALTSDLAAALDSVFPPDTVFIASTDMSHGNYPPYKGTDEIRPVDLHTLDLIKAMNITAVEQGVRNETAPMCGALPVLTLMNLAKLRGAEETVILKYADSGDASGDHSKVVGYGCAAFVIKGPAQAGTPPGGFSLSREEKIELLKMARAVVNAAVRGEDAPPLPTNSPSLKANGAAFVTLKTHGELRGCIGSMIADEPLFECVQRRALDAALHDPRFVFNRLSPAELAALEIEISVLTPPALVKAEDIVVGRDGVLLTLGPHRGVFLPQVPIEQGWDHDEYLGNLCHKAGLGDLNCWRDPDVRLESFQAIVFSEGELGFR